MITTIEQQLSILGEGINWVKSNLKGERQQSAYSKLVEQRRRLKKIKNAISLNPAVVLYGASQCGKSHLASSLLSFENKSLEIIVNEAGLPSSVPFLTHLNPQGDGEATGLITRFTTQQVSTIENFSVKVRLMSVKDIILMLCEGYYNDVTKREPISLSEIESILQIASNNTSSSIQHLLEEDDIWDIKDYFYKHISQDAFNNLITTYYFERVAGLIEFISKENWNEVISILWNNNQTFTQLWEQYLLHYSQIDFADELYISIDALLNNTDKPNTLLNVGWLDELNINQTKINVCYYIENAVIQKSFSKAFLAALGAEVILHISPELQKYKPFLKDVDILDFPGARSKENAVAVTSDTMPMILRRGKVSYYFNKYSTNREINTLLFCFEPDNFEAKPMGDRLESWINDMIGDTPMQRQERLANYKISPLFFIGTKFNNQLELKTTDRADNKGSLNERWIKWFETHLLSSIITPANSWFDNWTESQKHFNNIFLLRDFRYSTKIFSGWSSHGDHETKEYIPQDYTEFRTDLRKSFIENPFVTRHFHEPSTCWDAAAVVNKDGSELIIKKLSESAAVMKEARHNNFMSDISDTCSVIVSELIKYYHDENSDNNLTTAKRLAGEAQAALDIAYGRDPYFFGKMMQCFVLNEGNIYNVFHQEFQNTNLQEKKDFSKYVYVRMKAIGLSPKNTFEENLSILAKTYEMPPEDCQKYFESREFDLNELFAGTDEGMKNISQSLAELLESYLFTNWLRLTQYKALTQLLDATTLDSILEMLQALYKKLGMTQHIAHAIRQYVDKFGTNVDEIQEMIADMCAEILNKFISSVGYSYLSEDAVMALKDANTQQNLGLVFMEDEIREETISPATIASIFEAMDDLETLKNNLDCERLKYIPGVISRKTWSELLKIGFIQTQDIPNYDVAANHALGSIIQKLNIA